MGEITWQALLSCTQRPKKPGDLDCWPVYRTGCLISSIPMEPGDLDCLPARLHVGLVLTQGTSETLDTQMYLVGEVILHSGGVSIMLRLWK